MSSWVFEKGGREETLIPLPNMLISHIRVGVCVCKHETNDLEKKSLAKRKRKGKHVFGGKFLKRQNDLFFSHTHVPFIFRGNSLVKKILLEVSTFPTRASENTHLSPSLPETR